MPPKPMEPVAPSDAPNPERVVQLLDQALDLLDSLPDTEHLAARIQAVADELRHSDDGYQ